MSKALANFGQTFCGDFHSNKYVVFAGQFRTQQVPEYALYYALEFCASHERRTAAFF